MSTKHDRGANKSNWKQLYTFSSRTKIGLGQSEQAKEVQMNEGGTDKQDDEPRKQ